MLQYCVNETELTCDARTKLLQDRRRTDLDKRVDFVLCDSMHSFLLTYAKTVAKRFRQHIY